MNLVLSIISPQTSRGWPAGISDPVRRVGRRRSFKAPIINEADIANALPAHVAMSVDNRRSIQY